MQINNCPDGFNELPPGHASQVKVGAGPDCLSLGPLQTHDYLALSKFWPTGHSHLVTSVLLKVVPAGHGVQMKGDTRADYFEFSTLQ